MTDDPQAALLDAMTDEEVLDTLGPSWEKMSAAERHAYQFPRCQVPRENRTSRRRWWEAA